MADLVALRPLSLRDRLLALRSDVLRQLAEADYIEPGYLNMLAGIAAALAALDDDLPADAVPADRVVLIDNGEAVQLVTYAGAGCVAAVTLSPTRALTLARSLLDAALRRRP